MTRGVVAAAVTIAAVMMTGCTANADQPSDPTTTGPQSPTMVIPYDELLNQKTVTRAITLQVGDTLQVSLGSSPSTGFQWAPQMRISNPTVLVQSGPGQRGLGPAGVGAGHHDSLDHVLATLGRRREGQLDVHRDRHGELTASHSRNSLHWLRTLV